MTIDWNADVNAMVKAGNNAIKLVFRKAASYTWSSTGSSVRKMDD